MINEAPIEPMFSNIVLGVMKIPVPIIDPMIREIARERVRLLGRLFEFDMILITIIVFFILLYS